MKAVEYVLAVLAVFAFLAAPVRAQTSEDEIEDAIKKLDEYYKKLRKDLEEKLKAEREARGVGKDKPKDRDGGKDKASLGLKMTPITKGVRVMLNLEADEGVAVKKVTDGSPAEAAGLKVHDIILSVDGKKVGSVEDMQGALDGVRPGDELALRILRDGRRMDVKLVAGKSAGEAQGKEPSGAEKEVDRFLDQSHKSRRDLISGFLKDLLGDDMEKRLRARRFFERLATQSKENRERIVKEIEKAADELVAGLSESEKAELRKIFDELLGGLRDSFRKPSGSRSQKVEDIEKYLDDLLSGKKKEGAKPSEDEVDKLIEDLLRDKKGADEGKGGQGMEIPKELEEMLKGFLGKDAWERVKEMLKDPAMAEMAKRYMPADNKVTPEWIRKIMAQFGVAEEELPDRLKEMGVDEEVIKKIVDLLKKNPAPAQPSDQGKPYLGIKAGELGREQLDKLGVPAGIAISSITAGSPAEKAGLLVNDVILKGNSIEIRSTEDLKTLLSGVKVGDEVRFTVLRDGYKKVVTVTIGGRK